jgi:hypothetical protein
MNAVRSSETSENFCQTPWHYIPNDSTLRSHRCEDIKSHTPQQCYYLDPTSVAGGFEKINRLTKTDHFMQSLTNYTNKVGSSITKSLFYNYIFVSWENTFYDMSEAVLTNSL